MLCEVRQKKKDKQEFLTYLKKCSGGYIWRNIRGIVRLPLISETREQKEREKRNQARKKDYEKEKL